MSKRVIISLVVLIIIMVMIVITMFPIFPHRVRLISVRVIDSINKKPIENVVVYYILETARLRNFFGIPLIDPYVFRNLIKIEAKTNSEGYVKFSGRIIFLYLYETLNHEYIYVNYDRIRDNKESFFDTLATARAYNPLPEYKGALINSIPGIYKTKKYNSRDYNDILQRIVLERSFIKKQEVVTVELEKW